MAVLLCMTANINRDPDKQPKEFTVYDFAPWLKVKEEITIPQEDEEAKMIADLQRFKRMVKHA